MNVIKIFSFEFTIGEFVGICITIASIIIGSIITILRTVVPRINNRKERINKSYRVVWKKSSNLKPDDIFGKDSYRYKENIPYCYSKMDKTIKNKILNGQNILIIGRPLAGKTRTIYQNLKELEKEYYVIVPSDGVKLDSIIIPNLKFLKRRKLIVLDNLQNFLKREEPEKKETAIEEFISKLSKKNIQTIASCRSGFEFDILKNKISILSIIGKLENIVKIPKLEKDEAKEIIKKKWKQYSFSKLFDGTIGSLILPLEEMQNRFVNAESYEKNILIALKMLYNTGVYSERGLFLTGIIKLLCSNSNLKVSEDDFTRGLDNLEKKEFIEIENYDEVRARDVYLEKIVTSKHRNDFEIFNDVINTFKKYPVVLFLCGDRAYDKGLICPGGPKYLEIATTSYSEVLKVYTLKNYPIVYGLIQNNLGASYFAIAEIKDKENNCNKAITALKESLKVRTIEDYPKGYAVTINNLGAAYKILADVKDKEKNCKNAIIAFKKTLKVYTPKKHPIDYATTQNNLGATYLTIAQIKDKENNCNKAITALKESLRIKTIKDYPDSYATIQNNLGVAYSALAKVKDKEKNCTKAIDAYREALRVYSLKDYPIYCAITQNNLGATYRTLAKVKDKESNCKKAMDAYKEALKVYIKSDYPLKNKRLKGIIEDLKKMF